MLIKQSKVLDCKECKAFEENPKEFAKKEICPACVHKQEVNEPIIHKLIHYMSLQDAGCQLERHELTDEQWISLGILKQEREKNGQKSI